MTPSLSTREQAAKLYEAAWKAEDLMVAAEDDGVDEGRMRRLDEACQDAWKDYYDICDLEGFELYTDASGYVIRCAKTNIPICDLDECVEIETGELIRVKQAA